MRKILFLLIIIFNLFGLTCCDNGSYDLQKDIENIYKLKKEEIIIIDPIPSLSLGSQINNLESKSYYLAKTNFDKIYILCGYVDSDKYVGINRTLEYYENLTWIKYKEINEVTDQFNGKIISDLFMVFDITIKKDILNNINFINSNKFSFKYYCDIEENYKNKSEIKKPYEEFIIWYNNNLKKMDNICLNVYDMKHTFEVMKTNRTYYVIFDDKISYEDSNIIKYLLKENSGKYYDLFEKVIISDDKLIKYVEIDNGSNYYLYKAKIKLEDFIKICKGK